MKYYVHRDTVLQKKRRRDDHIKNAAFFIIGANICYLLSFLVHSSLNIPYAIYCFVMLTILILPSKTNPKRRVWQALMIYIRYSAIDKKRYYRYYKEN